jgi:penicillin-binding protein 1A
MSGLRIAAIVSCISILAIPVTAFIWLKTLGVFSLDANRITDLERFSYTDNTLIFDRDGHKIGEFFDRYQVFVPVEELPTELRQAILAIEDRTFMQHKGVDTNAMMRAVWSRVKTGKIKQGASTITQQVVKQMILSNEKTIERKVLEIAWALKLEKSLSKNQILQIYTNNMFLGNGAYGVGAAALRYFGKDVRKLNTAECALIAGLFQSPSRYNPAKYPKRAKLRQQSVPII